MGWSFERSWLFAAGVKLPQALAELGSDLCVPSCLLPQPGPSTAGLLHPVNDVVAGYEVQSSGGQHNDACVL